jgi:hypothetical protein
MTGWRSSPDPMDALPMGRMVPGRVDPEEERLLGMLEADGWQIWMRKGTDVRIEAWRGVDSHVVTDNTTVNALRSTAESIGLIGHRQPRLPLFDEWLAND